MSLSQMLETPELSSEQQELVNQFLERTGYSSNDILSRNYQTRRFLTKNGGRYEINLEGQIKHLAGPPPDPEDRYL